MKIYALFLLVVAVATAVEESNPLENGVYNYHNRIGIPEALRIRKLESEISDVQSRIAGGSTTTIFSVPYQAGLLISIGLVSTSVCGGTVISDTRILTGAHCYNDGNNIAKSITVVLGSNLLFSGGTRITTIDIVTHPGYNPWIIANDIAIMRINKVNFSLTIQPINLPAGSEINSNYIGINGLASGYGITKHGDSINLLQTINSVSLQVISNAACANVYGNLILGTHLCTNGSGSKGVCGGDTGGPLVANSNGNRKILIGVSSFTASAGCQAGQPSGFTRVTSYINWIHSI